MRVLVLGFVWPEPGSSAAGGRLCALMTSFLQQGWAVHFASAAAPTDYAADLPALGISTQTIALNCSSFNDYLAQLQPDLVLFDRFMTEEQFGWRVAQVCPQALRVLDTEDLHSLRAAREQLLRQALKQPTEQAIPGPVLAGAEVLYAEMAGSDIAQREIAAIYRCDLSLMISSAEMHLLTSHFGVPDSLLLHTSFMVSGAALPRPGFAERRDFISIGNFRHAPNWDAVLWLKQAIWPLIRAELPQARLQVYGAYVMPKASQLHNEREGFLIQGRAPDALAVMASARVCLAPLRFGAGLKGKLLDALCTGTPSVTTAIGCEGMAPATAWPGAVDNSAQGLAQAAVQLYRSEADWCVAQQCTDALLRSQFDGESIARALVARLVAVREQLDEHRRSNFIGAMLNHHRHKSTQYMSQWIEAKTRLKALQ